MKQAILMVCLSALVLKASAADTPLPIVEVEFQQTVVGEWSGKRLSEIVPPESIKRIILTQDSGIIDSGIIAERPHVNSTTGTWTIYDALISHFFKSTEKASAWQLGANERTLAEMAILTASGGMFRIEILGGNDKGSLVPVAVLVRERKKSARIEVKNFKFPIPKQ